MSRVTVRLRGFCVLPSLQRENLYPLAGVARTVQMELLLQVGDVTVAAVPCSVSCDDTEKAKRNSSIVLVYEPSSDE